ncbi:hypothetical protein IE996_02740 [Klebsiella pneumoniae]|uniref:Uncharacterized protein n=1 Tax=Klebsiella pneumoniae TaxID=573 RepID=A0A927DLP6_KLEPN|nr:hypothetical protein [Klebsiella pneumoniae]
MKINNEKQFVMFENTLWKPKVQSNYPIVLKGESKDVIDILNQNFSLIITPNNDMNKTNTNIVLASHFGVKGNGIPCGGTMRRSNKLYYDKWWYIALSSPEKLIGVKFVVTLMLRTVLILNY